MWLVLCLCFHFCTARFSVGDVLFEILQCVKQQRRSVVCEPQNTPPSLANGQSQSPVSFKITAHSVSDSQPPSVSDTQGQCQSSWYFTDGPSTLMRLIWSLLGSMGRSVSKSMCMCSPDKSNLFILVTLRLKYFLISHTCKCKHIQEFRLAVVALLCGRRRSSASLPWPPNQNQSSPSVWAFEMTMVQKSAGFTVLDYQLLFTLFSRGRQMHVFLICLNP